MQYGRLCRGREECAEVGHGVQLLSFPSLSCVQTRHDVARCGTPEGTVQLHLPQSGKRHHKQVRGHTKRREAGAAKGAAVYHGHMHLLWYPFIWPWPGCGITHYTSGETVSLFH